MLCDRGDIAYHGLLESLTDHGQRVIPLAVCPSLPSFQFSWQSRGPIQLVIYTLFCLY